MDENKYPNQIDTTLIKMFHKSVQEGDLSVIQSNVTKYSFDMKVLKDPENGQNAFFYSALIKDDKEYFNIIINFFYNYIINEIVL